MSEIRPQDIRYAAMDLLARREHLYRELEQKLARRFSDAEANLEANLEAKAELITEILQQLRDENLQSDQRFVESYIRHRSARGYGPDRVRQELRQKGAASELVDEEMQCCEINWRELARDARSKRFGEALPEDYTEKARQLRFLQYRGFSGDYASFAFDD